MEGLLRNNIAKSISDSGTIQSISHDIYNRLRIESLFIIKDADNIPEYTSEEVYKIPYSSKDNVLDIISRLKSEAVLQKYHCFEYAVAIVTELFTHYSVDVILKCCGIMLYYNKLPVLALTNSSNTGSSSVATIDLYAMEEQVTIMCGTVTNLVDNSVQKFLQSTPNNNSHSTLFAILVAFLGIVSVTAICRHSF